MWIVSGWTLLVMIGHGKRREVTIHVYCIWKTRSHLKHMYQCYIICVCCVIGVFFLIFTVKLKNSIISLEKFCFKESKPTRGPWAILLTWETFLTLSLHEAMIWVLRKNKDNHLPFENEMVLYLKKLKSLSPKNG